MRKAKAVISTVLFIIPLASMGILPDTPAGERIFKAALVGSEEVPPLKTNAKGEAIFEVSTEGETLTYTLTASNIKDVTAA